MGFPEATVKVIGADKCPLYKLYDKFKLVGKSLTTPDERPTCLVLARDILNVLVKAQKFGVEQKYVFDCSECVGLIRLEYCKEADGETDKAIEKYQNINKTIEFLLGVPIFATLDEENIRSLITFLRLRDIKKDEIIIEMGQPGKNLYIILEGGVDVIGPNNIKLTYLGMGEIFGEMSLLSGDPVGATIKVADSGRVLYLNGEFFRKVLNKFPSIQMYMARMLADRLAKTNMMRTEDLYSGVMGELSEMPPEELFQTFNLNQKNGTLNLILAKGNAEVSFRDGGMVGAKYADKNGREAIFEIMREKKGTFKFTSGLSLDAADAPQIGELMGLLLEGSRRIDENDTD